MTALILMLIWLSQVLPVVSDLPEPRNLRVNSSHFHHMLQWEAGVGSPPGVYYKVTFTTHSETNWTPVVGCEHVQRPLVCNLTVALSNLEGYYITKVVAVLDKHYSEKINPIVFHPIRDTHLDPPRLTVTSCGLDLCLNLDPPMERMRATYGRFKYQLRIESTTAYQPRSMEITSLKEEVLKDLPPGRDYCVSVKISGFLNDSEPRLFNFSQPKCVFIPGHFNKEPPIATGLCFSVIFILVVLGFLYCTGFICLKKTPLPFVLMSIRHTDELLSVPSLVSLPSILSVKPTAPSSGKKRNSQTESSDSDEETVTDVPGGGRGRGQGYKLRVGTKLLSTSSSSSSSSLSAPLSPNCFPTNQNTLSVPPDVFSALPETPIAANASTSTSTSTADSLTAKRTEREEEAEEGTMEGDSKDVNLLTLTFGTHKEKEEEPALVDLRFPPPASEETSVLLSHICHFNEAAEESDICSDDEEEEDEYDGANEYMRR